MVIVIKADGYEVIVNGKSHCMYRHRIALEKVSAVGIWGGVSVLFYGFIQNWSASTLSSPSSMIVIPSEISNPVIQPKIPYIAPVGVEIKQGVAFYVEGTIPADGDQ
ncbi:galectin-8-like [Silurus meridionalis]|uniref:galectin-8-like n=1 Tax=Silurus meridionalis TaxID=175797 RepID=UPI001EEBA793|nr:galectin-8-like [Silurus meridionalis]